MFIENMMSNKRSLIDMAHHLENFLVMYQITPHITIGMPLCELLLDISLPCTWIVLPYMEYIVYRSQ